MSDHETTDSDRTAAEREGLAGRGARLGAYVIDWLIIGAVTFGIAWYAGLFERIMRQDATATLWVTLIGLAVFAVINLRLLAQHGQTVGKRLVGVRIVDAAAREIVPVWKSFGLRVVVIQGVASIPVVGGLFALVDVLFIFGERRRCLHDHLAGTIVVDADAAN